MTDKFDVVVQKYGGSSVATPEKIKAVASAVRSSLATHERIVVVVSAMGHTTNELITLAYQVSCDPSKRELDMLISCGERSSMALLAMALNDIGVKAVSLTGSQSGIITDDIHSGAEIIAIKPSRVLEAFKTHQVVIIAGFQGVSEQKEITTLRRGGSDTTAVAMAAALGATGCEIYTDVPGVMDADPRIANHAQVLPTVTFEQMESMALYGAKVLAHDAIKIAEAFGVVVRIGKPGQLDVGTEIRKEFTGNNRSVLALTNLRALIRVSMKQSELGKIQNRGGYFLCGAQRGDDFIGYISNDISQELLSTPELDMQGGLALITIHLAKNQCALPVISHVSNILQRYNLASIDLVVGRHEIFLVITDARLNEALSMLHEALIAKEMVHECP